MGKTLLGQKSFWREILLEFTWCVDSMRSCVFWPQRRFWTVVKSQWSWKTLDFWKLYNLVILQVISDKYLFLLRHLILDINDPPRIFSTSDTFSLPPLDCHIGTNHRKWWIDVFFVPVMRTCEILQNYPYLNIFLLPIMIRSWWKNPLKFRNFFSNRIQSQFMLLISLLFSEYEWMRTF